MRTIKEKVIDAANDSNTDDDRLTIQKEINHYFDEIESIAYETEFNGQKLLIGNKGIRKVTVEYETYAEPIFVEGSDYMDVIKEDRSLGDLDGQKGPFALFDGYKNSALTTIESLFGADGAKFSGGTPDKPAYIEFDFDKYSSPDELIGRGFNVSGKNYFFRDSSDYSTKYNDEIEDLKEISVDFYSLNWREEAAKALKDAVTGKTTELVGNKLKITGGSIATIKTTPLAFTMPTDYYPQSGIVPQTMTGGANKDTKSLYIPVPDPDIPDATKIKTVYDEVPAKRASLTVDISEVLAGSAIVLKGRDNKRLYLKFVAGNDTPTQDFYGDLTVPINYSSDKYFDLSNSISVKVKNGKMTLQANTSDGEHPKGNNWGIESDGIAEVTISSPVKGIDSIDISTVEKHAQEPGEFAHYDLNLTQYDTTDENELENLIKDCVGKAFMTYEFIDTKNPASLNAVKKFTSFTPVDLNSLRSAVNGGTTIADAFIELMTSKDSGTFSDNSDGNEKILRIKSGSTGDSNISFSAATPEYFSIDYGDWFEKNGASISKSLSEFLKGKGFRFYCSTCDAQWFNVKFSMTGEQDDEPVSSSTADKHSIDVDVSSLANADLSSAEGRADAARNLVKLISQAGNEKIDHVYKFAVDDEAANRGILQIYDSRMMPLYKRTFLNLQQSGHAKISDGIYDDVIKLEREVSINERRMTIQHTDKENQNITLRIPQTSLNHIFQPTPKYPDMSNYNVLTKENRDFLLGNRVVGADKGTPEAEKSKGDIDKGIDYLLDALTLVGAQNARLETTNSNVVTELENEIGSESTIRDADMAKEMTAYTKANVLSQAAQAMLAQANRNSSAVLSLLK